MKGTFYIQKKFYLDEGVPDQRFKGSKPVGTLLHHHKGEKERTRGLGYWRGLQQINLQGGPFEKDRVLGWGALGEKKKKKSKKRERCKLSKKENATSKVTVSTPRQPRTG